MCFFTSVHKSKAQLRYKVLFLGNSYTYVNDLPQLVHDVALSAGDTLDFDSHTVGAYQLIDHSSDAVSQGKIMAGGWDYVVLQGQSQEPIMANNDFTTGAYNLYSLIKQYDTCAVVMPYMTWGRKNGDAANCPSWPLMCTYLSMDTTLRNRYLTLTKSTNGEVAPVSVVWNYLRQNHPGIELYQPDESHPSAAGSYAAACCFYAMLFKKDPTLISFNFGLSASDAATIRNAAKIKVFNNLSAWDFKKLPTSNFTYQIGAGVNEVDFDAISMGVGQYYFWDFGDGGTSSAHSPTHSYAANGIYTVSLTTRNCDLQGLHTSFTDTVIQFCGHTPTVFTTHPWLCVHDTLWTQPADSYQWLSYGLPIPETGQFIADQSQYGPSGFSVISTVNGCSELSQPLTMNVESSGYYFDLIGDPCTGDTVAFAVLHINGFLSGSESIRWFRNDTLLPSATNEDTLLITAGGKYQCKVIDPASHCPSDTTSYTIEYNCGGLAVAGPVREASWSVFPNPASSAITVRFAKPPMDETIQIYTTIGRLAKELKASSTQEIDISILPPGLYFIRMKKGEGEVLRFVKR